MEQNAGHEMETVIIQSFHSGNDHATVNGFRVISS